MESISTDKRLPNSPDAVKIHFLLTHIMHVAKTWKGSGVFIGAVNALTQSHSNGVKKYYHH